MISLPKTLIDNEPIAKKPQGSIEWRMHSSYKMCSIMWMDKEITFILSTHQPFKASEKWFVIVPKRSNHDQNMWRPHLQLQYTTYMLDLTLPIN